MATPDPRPRPIDHILLDGNADAPALVTKSVTLSYGAAERRVGTLAGLLKALQLPVGSQVATWLPKTSDACLMPLATARAGLVHVPINPVLRRAQVAHILADSGAALLLTNEGRRATLGPDDVPDGCAIWLEDKFAEERTIVPPSNADPDALAAILYTSGSTGRPKGVMLSHANLWLGAVSVAHYLALTGADRTLAILPFGFDYGQNQLLSTWRAGGAVIPLDYLAASDVRKAVVAHAITTIAAVPPLWVQLLEQDWSEDGAGVRRVTNSGGALTPKLIEQMAQTFPNADIVPMYGLTEAFRSTWLPPALVAKHPTSIGQAIPFAEVMIVDDVGNPADRGELVHAGPLVAQGYWRDPVRTAARFRPAPTTSYYGGTAVWSGDTVRRDADGLLYFEGRDDAMIKSSGHRISPHEIEEVALASGAAREAVAFGVPDARAGQAIILVVTGASDGASLRTYLTRELPSHMHPRAIHWRAAMPLNANGKIDRAALAHEYGA